MIDTDKYEETDHPELAEFEGETLGDTLTNLLTEVKRLREILGDIVAIDEWGGDGKEVGITIRFTEGGSFSGWLHKVSD